MFKHLKAKLAVLAVLVGISVGGLGAVGTPAASAGVCNYIGYTTSGHPGEIWYNSGYWEWSGLIGQCSGITGIEYGNTGNNAMFDQTRGFWHNATLGGVVDQNGTTHLPPDMKCGGLAASPYQTTCQVVYDVPVWGSGCGAPPFQVYRRYSYRLQSLSGGVRTWGPWHTKDSASTMIC